MTRRMLSVFSVGDRVEFLDHDGKVAIGTITTDKTGAVLARFGILYEDRELGTCLCWREETDLRWP